MERVICEALGWRYVDLCRELDGDAVSKCGGVNIGGIAVNYGFCESIGEARGYRRVGRCSICERTFELAGKQQGFKDMVMCRAGPGGTESF
jgi:hypothetical protein